MVVYSARAIVPPSAPLSTVGRGQMVAQRRRRTCPGLYLCYPSASAEWTADRTFLVSDCSASWPSLSTGMHGDTSMKLP